MVEQWKNLIKRIKNGGYPVQWLNQQAERFARTLRKEENIQIVTEIPRITRLAQESRAKEMYIRKVLEERTVSFRHPLVVINPYRIAPLTALVLFCTKKPCAVRYTVCGRNGGKDLIMEFKERKTEHRIPVLGLYPGVRNQVIMKLTDSEGRQKQKTLHITTFVMKQELEGIVDVHKHIGEASEEYIYVSGGFAKESYIFDSTGEIRFYFSKRVKLYGTHMLSGGHLLFPERNIANPTFSNPHSNVFHEMDFMGRVYRTYMVENGVHHFASEKGEGGNILLATSTLKEKLGMENAILEIERQTGDVIKLLNLNDFFDNTYQNRHDWAHLNSIQYLPKEDAVILSLRNLHSVVKIRWGEQKLEWILANPRFWENTSMIDKVLTPETDDITWFYQQHAAEVTASFGGRTELLLYDNHLAGRRPVDFMEESEYSYLTLFLIDEKKHTVAMEKKFTMNKSAIRSNGVLGKERRRIFGMSASLRPMIGDYKGMVDEFDFETGEVMNQYFLKKDFFSAYPIHFEPEEMSRSLNLELPYEVGHVIRPEKITREDAQQLGWQEEARQVDSEYFKTCILNNLLLIKETDNEIRNVYAVGRKQIYRLDKSKTVQRAVDTFGDERYYITFPLENCEPDIYTFYLQTSGHIFRVEKTIEIQNGDI